MQSNGLATLLLMIPVLTVPALAIFGIPQFAPVVASSLDEGGTMDRESRAGNSARQSRDDLFGDVDGFGSEPESQDSLPKRRDTKVGARKSGTPSSKSSNWDFDTNLGQKKRSNQHSFQSTENDVNDVESNELRAVQTFPDAKNTGKPSAFERNHRDNRFQGEALIGDETQATANSELYPRFAQTVFDDDDNPPKSQGANRSQHLEPRHGKPSGAAAEPLTWKSAVDRLSENEIHNFRLERGHQVDQFIFICTYSPPENPGVSYRFEAEADQPLKAVEKVLEQISEKQWHR